MEVAARVALRAQLPQEDDAVFDAVDEAPLEMPPKRLELRRTLRPELHGRQPRRSQVLPDGVSGDG
jgi:hypothetical protein